MIKPYDTLPTNHKKFNQILQDLREFFLEKELRLVKVAQDHGATKRSIAKALGISNQMFHRKYSLEHLMIGSLESPHLKPAVPDY